MGTAVRGQGPTRGFTALLCGRRRTGLGSREEGEAQGLCHPRSGSRGDVAAASGSPCPLAACPRWDSWKGSRRRNGHLAPGWPQVGRRAGAELELVRKLETPGQTSPGSARSRHLCSPVTLLPGQLPAGTGGRLLHPLEDDGGQGGAGGTTPALGDSPPGPEGTVQGQGRWPLCGLSPQPTVTR